MRRDAINRFTDNVLPTPEADASRRLRARRAIGIPRLACKRPGCPCTLSSGEWSRSPYCSTTCREWMKAPNP